jgi:Tol biopolymer transport system component
MSLWKMNVDGSAQQLMTDHASLPQWSPDGRRIAFMGVNDDSHKPTKIHFISVDGGHAEQPVPSPEWQGAPTWTADGNGLIFGENGPTFPIRESCAIHLFDFKSGKTSDLPGSTGLWTARACPTGRYVAAVTRDNRKLVLYDMRAAAWAELATFADSEIGANPAWSTDGKFVYIDAPESSDPAIYRISVPGKRMERVASLKGIQRVHGHMGLWIGLTPDNLPLILRAVQSNQIFAWDWIAP